MLIIGTKSYVPASSGSIDEDVVVTYNNQLSSAPTHYMAIGIIDL